MNVATWRAHRAGAIMGRMGEARDRAAGGYDAARDPVLLATWAEVAERSARAWLEGARVDSPDAAALEKAAAAIRCFVDSPEHEEIVEEVRRFRRLPPLRRLEASDAATRFDLRLREAYRSGVR